MTRKTNKWTIKEKKNKKQTQKKFIASTVKDLNKVRKERKKKEPAYQKVFSSSPLQESRIVLPSCRSFHKIPAIVASLLAAFFSPFDGPS